MTARTQALAAALLAICAPSALATDIVLDHFDDAYPSQLVGGTPAPLIFVGTLAQGQTHLADAAQQDGLPGVLGGQRDAYLQGFGIGPGGGSSLTSVIGNSRVSYNSGFGTTAIFTLEYGARTPLDLDVSVAEAVVLRGLGGDMDDGFTPRPVPTRVTLTSGFGTNAAASEFVDLIVLDDGDYAIPRAAWSLVDFSDIDSVRFEFDGRQVQAIDFAFDSIGFRVPSPAVDVFCAGDGSADGVGIDCPCGNNGAPGEGCANGTGQGALLQASGIPSITSDTLVLSASQVPAGAPGMYFAAPLPAAQGDGLPFGNGLRCLLQPVRLNKVHGGGQVPAQGAPSLSQLLGLQAGDTVYFQYWFRDAQGPCNGALGVNTTNGLRVTWGL